MIEAQKEPTAVEREAADWYSRMLNPPVENEELAAFEAWRREPANLAAYNRLEDIGRLALSLRDDPDLRAVAAQARQRHAKSRPWYARLLATRPRQWGAGLAFAGVTAAAGFTWMLVAPTYETAIGQQRQTVLADGSRVTLNTDTALKVRFDGKIRRVELLRGQAFFDVAHDAAKPFIVAAGDTEVRAIGTRFDVRREASAVKVVLAEGRVLVQEAGFQTATWTLKPGQSVTTSANLQGERPVPVDVAVDTSWTSGQLTFRGTSLAQAIDEVNRYSRDKVVLGADTPADARINGIFPVGKPDEFVTAMTTLYGLHAERRKDGAIELRGGAD